MANVIAILDSDGNALLESVTNISVSVIPSKTFAKHSLENKQVVTDDQFDNPTSLTMQVILSPADYVDIYKEIKGYYESVTNFTIQTKVDSYSNMYLESIPHDESGAMFNTVSMSLTFTEQLIVESTTMTVSDVSSASDASVSNSGNKSTTKESGTVLSRLFSGVFD